MSEAMTAREQAQEILDRYRPVVDVEIARVLEGREDIALYQMVRYHLGFPEMAGGEGRGFSGKRVRAALCLLACEAAGGEPPAAAPAAAAIELLHSFTLLHDDIADRDELRRGRPTVWHRWGVGEAITAGDALFALAQITMGRIARAGVPAATASAVTREFNEAVLAVCEGQQLDLSYEGRSDVSVEDYLHMIARKTAVLFSATAGIGAQIAGAPAAVAGALREFGRHLGVAYQIRDDVLGIWGQPDELGKPVGSDLRRNKRSLPIVHALATAGEKGARELAARLARGIESDREAEQAAAGLERLGSREFCERMARESLGQALRALEGAGLREEPTEDLKVLARCLIERTS